MPKYVLRFGVMRALGVFTTRGERSFKHGDEVIARTPRGLESGEVLCEATPDALSHLDNPPTGQILRTMSSEDGNELLHMQTQAGQEFAVCKEHIEKLNLPMELVDVEHLFGGERIVVYYLAENRVDFRKLVKTLATELQTRIEMRQIGVRDEAKLLADYGDCGKPVCCNTHLTKMPPVSMRMAKLQKATLDPTKISGRCGRLKCCLRYEFDTYDELQKDLPNVGSDVVTTQGRARVIGQEILTSQVLISTEDHRRMLIDASEVLTVLRQGDGSTRKPRRGNQQKDSSEESKKEPSKDSKASERTPSSSGESKQSSGRPKKQSTETKRKSKPAEEDPQGDQSKPN